jgi:hypothetical protein
MVWTVRQGRIRAVTAYDAGVEAKVEAKKEWERSR